MGADLWFLPVYAAKTVLPGRQGVSVVRRVIDDDAEAARFGMHGSPTLLVDGLDPFAEPGMPTGVSCRLYRGADGRTEGAPPVAALRQAIDRAAGPDQAPGASGGGE